MHYSGGKMSLACLSGSYQRLKKLSLPLEHQQSAVLSNQGIALQSQFVLDLHMQILKEERAAVFNFLGMVRLVRLSQLTPEAAFLLPLWLKCSTVMPSLLIVVIEVLMTDVLLLPGNAIV